MHDRTAELRGYRNELAAALANGQTRVIGPIQEQIDRVTREIETMADAADAQEQAARELGQDGVAEQHKRRAAELRSHLDDGMSDTADSSPLEQAVRRGPGRPRKDTY